MSDMIDLLPCPFCGAALTWEAPVAFVHPIGKCILSGRNFKKGPIQQWNRRAALPPAPDAELVQKLHKSADPSKDAVEALVKARVASAVNQAVRIVLDEVGYEEADLCPNCQAALAAIRAGGDFTIHTTKETQ